MGVRLFKKLLLALVDAASKNLDQTTLAQITPAELMHKVATMRNTPNNLKCQDASGVGHGRPRELLDPASMNPEQLTPHQDLPNEEIQKSAMGIHLEVQQREDFR